MWHSVYVDQSLESFDKLNCNLLLTARTYHLFFSLYRQQHRDCKYGDCCISPNEYW